MPLRFTTSSLVSWALPLTSVSGLFKSHGRTFLVLRLSSLCGGSRTSSSESVVRATSQRKNREIAVRSAVEAQQLSLMRKKIAIACILGVGVLTLFHVKHASAALRCDNTSLGGLYNGIQVLEVARNDGSCGVYGGTLGSIGEFVQMDIQTNYSGTLRIHTVESGSSGATPCTVGSNFDQTYLISPGLNSLPTVIDMTSNQNTCVLRFEPSGSGEVEVASWDVSYPSWLLYDSSNASSTRIIVTDPLNREYVSTTTATGASVYVSPDDFRDGMYLSMNFVNNTLAASGGSALDAWNAAFGEIVLPLSVGLNNVSQNTTFLMNGQVNATWKIKIPNTTPIIGSFLPAQTIVSTSTIFIVGYLTGLDIAMASTTDLLVNALLTGTTTGQSILNCNFVNPLKWDVVGCLVSLVIPPQSVLQNDFDQLKDGLFEKWPLGYVTRMIEILAASTTRDMPVLSATIPQGVIGAGASITLDINGVLDQFLYATTGQFINSSAPSNRTLYDITNDYWEIFVYICLGLYILRRLLGAHLIGDTWSGSDSEQKKKQALWEDSITDRIEPGKRKR